MVPTPLAEGWNVQPMPFGFEAEGEIPSSKPHNGEPFRALHLLRRLIIATGNPIKVAEIEAMLGPLPIEVQHQPDDLDVEETGSTYLENASLKASAAALRTKTWALADDSGLEVDALADPRFVSARYASGNAAKLQRPWRTWRIPLPECLFPQHDGDQ